MNAAAVWYLTLRLFAGDPLQSFGPFTEAECVSCGEALYARAGELAKRTGRKPGPGWTCLQAERAVEVQPLSATLRACSE